MKRHIEEADMLLNELDAETGFVSFHNLRDPTPLKYHAELPQPKDVKPGSIFVGADGTCWEAQGGNNFDGSQSIVRFTPGHHAFRSPSPTQGGSR